MPRLPADLRISLKRRRQTTQRIELIRQPSDSGLGAAAMGSFPPCCPTPPPAKLLTEFGGGSAEGVASSV